jgi:ribosomal protein S18 acetylase RimI-like enzyme
MYARVLHAPDQPTLEAFLCKHKDSSMVLRSNLLADGIEDAGGRFAGVYAGAFDDGGALRAVAAHYRAWGNVFPQAESDEALDAAVRCAVDASGERVRGVIGLRPLVRRTIERLELRAAQRNYDANEGLYALDLEQLRKPALLLDPEVELRALRPGDDAFYLEWLRDYEVSTLGTPDNDALRARCQADFERTLASGEPCVLSHAGIPRAKTTFNARLPDMVQIGGVYTPPAQRGRGYARAAVALSLVQARARRVARAVLFTGEDNRPAIAAYRAIGFTRIDDFAIVLFA